MKTFTCPAYQLEVRHSDSTLLIHLLLMLVLHQALHQVPGVQLIISHVLRKGQAEETQVNHHVNLEITHNFEFRLQGGQHAAGFKPEHNKITKKNSAG